MVGAQWLLVDAPNAAVLVSFVQAATTLPVMLFALPGGVLADSFDRRWLLFTIQVYFFVVGVLLAVLTAAGQMPPALLIAFTFLLGVGTAVQLPTWGATVPELVPRTQLRAASRLDLVSVNVSRAVGPALAGVVIAQLGGVSVVFALNAASVIVLAVALLRWRRPPRAASNREGFVPALRAGGRYVWHEPVVRRILLRAIMFVAPAMALWALLPVIASQHLHVGADGYGALFAALGAGAILGALVLGPLNTKLSTNGVLAAAGLLYAATLTVIALVPSFLAALAALVLSGVAWMAVTSTLQAELQLMLPAWVRARGVAVYMVTFTGAQTGGALLWGLVANRVGLRAGHPRRGDRGTRRCPGRSAPAGARDRPPRPPTRRLLDRPAASLRPATRQRAGTDRRTLHRLPRTAARLPDGDGRAPPVPAPYRRDPMGAIPRRRTPRTVRRGIPRPHLGRTPPAARGPAHGNRQDDRGSRTRLLRPAGMGRPPTPPIRQPSTHPAATSQTRKSQWRPASAVSRLGVGCAPPNGTGLRR